MEDLFRGEVTEYDSSVSQEMKCFLEIVSSRSVPCLVSWLILSSNFLML